MDAVIPMQGLATTKSEAARPESKPAPSAGTSSSPSSPVSAGNVGASPSSPSSAAASGSERKSASQTVAGLDMSQPANYRMALLAVSIVLVLMLVGLYAVLGGPRQTNAHEDPDGFVPVPVEASVPGAAGGAASVGTTTGSAIGSSVSPGTTGNAVVPAVAATATPVGASASAGQPGGTYRVQSDDNLWAIAKRVYGDGRAWSAIAHANPSVDPNRLRVGTLLQLPDAASVKMAAAAARPSPPPVTPTTAPAKAASVARPSPTATRTVVVLEGDTLMAIARRELGDKDKWELIYRANRDRLRNPNSLPVGMRLRVPQG